MLGIYSNYERDYGQQIIKITIEPVTKELLLKHIKTHLAGYETADYVDRVIKNLDIFDNIPNDDIENLVIAAADYVIDYSYTKIREYRLKQTENMFKCVQSKTVIGPKAFVESVYQYFEAKYYKELFKDVSNENISTAIKWIKKVEEDSDKDGETYLTNLSHLRSSAMKCMAARPQAYTPYLLLTYCTLKDENLYIRDGLDYYLKGLQKLSILRTNYRRELRQIVDYSLSTNNKDFLLAIIGEIKDYKGAELTKLQVFANKITEKLNEGYGLFTTEELEEA